MVRFLHFLSKMSAYFANYSEFNLRKKMKAFITSMAFFTCISGMANTEELKLYFDQKTGQVYTIIDGKQVRVATTILEEEPKKKSSFISTTDVYPNSPDFLLGKENSPSLKIKAQDSDMYLAMGMRLQTAFESGTKQYENGDDISYNDAYMRRVRLNMEAGFTEDITMVMDLRNDNANNDDNGEQQFRIGNAYINFSKPFDSPLVNFRLGRTKIDVSRTHMVSSGEQIHHDRVFVGDAAAQYITHNRRGPNGQIFGDWEKKIHYQIAFGDGVHSGTTFDASGKKLSDIGEIESQNFFYGGKIKFSPFEGWEEQKLTQTYFGQGKHFTAGVAYWKTGNIKTTDTVGTINNELTNIELSAHYNGLSMSAEYYYFDDVVKNWGSPDIGTSDGWYATAEYVFTDYSFIAPFVRYESWDKYKESEAGEDYNFRSKLAGINWYIRGNRIKASLALQKDEYGKSLGDYTDTRYKFTTQWFF